MAPKRKYHAYKGCKCNCKNANCLKRYCACFAAGNYCAEACSCKECFNVLDHKNKVDEARKQAEMRNPYAFSTKKVKDKQKVGCRCRVNMCSGGMCKCYKADVGCQDECRCVGCENVHGKRGDMITVPLDPLDEFLNQFLPQNINARQPSGVTNLPYIPSPFETLNHDMMIGTSTSDSSMGHVGQLEFMNGSTPQNFDRKN